MGKSNYSHYVCEFCEKEVVKKTDKDVESWIIITGGSESFNQYGRPLLITYMKGNYRKESKKPQLVIEDLHFCCKECLVKWMYRHLTGKPEIDKAVKVAEQKDKGSTKPINKPELTRFNDLDVNDHDDEK